MKSVAIFVLGLLIGAGALYWSVGRHPPPPGSPPGPAPDPPAWMIAPVPEARDDAAWKINTHTGETRFCIRDATQGPGCVRVRETSSLQELATAPQP